MSLKMTNLVITKVFFNSYTKYGQPYHAYNEYKFCKKANSEENVHARFGERPSFSYLITIIY